MINKKKYWLSIIFIFVILLSEPACTTPWRMLTTGRPNVTHTELFPNKVISKAEKSTAVFIENEKNALPPLNDWLSEYQNPHQNSNLEDFLATTTTTAFIVVRNDSILYEQYLNGHEKEGHQVVFSLTKSFITTLLVMAMEEGHIKSLQQKVSEFLPDFKDEKRANITLNDVLQMTSGLNYSDYTDNLVKLGRVYHSTNLKRLIKKAKVAHPPGSRFAYKSVDTQVLAFCLEAATGRDLTSYFEEKIWHPLGMTSEAYFTVDSKKQQNERTFGGLIVKSRDLLRFGKLFLDNGKWLDKQLVPEVWIEQIKDRKASENGQWSGYQNGWWREGFLDRNVLEGTDFYAAGFEGQLIYIHPESNVIIVRQGLKKGKVNWPTVIGSLIAKLQNKSLNNYEDQFAGTYKNKKNETIRIVARHDKWLLHHKDFKKPLDLKQYCPQSLYHAPKYIRTIFDVDPDTQQIVSLQYDDFKTLTHFEKMP